MLLAARAWCYGGALLQGGRLQGCSFRGWEFWRRSLKDPASVTLLQGRCLRDAVARPLLQSPWHQWRRALGRSESSRMGASGAEVIRFEPFSRRSVQSQSCAGTVPFLNALRTASGGDGKPAATDRIPGGTSPLEAWQPWRSIAVEDGAPPRSKRLPAQSASQDGAVLRTERLPGRSSSDDPGTFEDRAPPQACLMRERLGMPAVRVLSVRWRLGCLGPGAVGLSAGSARCPTGARQSGPSGRGRGDGWLPVACSSQAPGTGRSRPEPAARR